MFNSKKIAIVNYGIGNLSSIYNAFMREGASAYITSAPVEIAEADAIIFPGVGAFATAMEYLNQQKLLEVLKQQIIVKKKPFLGICLGMQLLFEKSYENGVYAGLGWLSGEVRALNASSFKVPHVGWNNVETTRKSALLQSMKTPEFYFVHSYYVDCDKKFITAETDYGIKIPAVLEIDNIYATQFHPERSGENGLALLRNFLQVT